MKYFYCTILVLVILVGGTSCSSEGAGSTYQNLKNKYNTSSPVTKSAIGGAAAGGVVGGLAGASLPVSIAAGAVIGGAIGKYLEKKQSEVRKLQGMGVYFIHLGDNVMIVIPSEMLFKGYSDLFSDTAYKTLGLIRDILSDMTKVSMKVAAYMPNPSQSQSDITLTQLQAVKVQSYLFSDVNAVDARFIYAEGYGSGHPVQFATDNAAQVNLNYRIEITLIDLSKAKSEI